MQFPFLPYLLHIIPRIKRRKLFFSTKVLPTTSKQLCHRNINRKKADNRRKRKRCELRSIINSTHYIHEHTEQKGSMICIQTWRVCATLDLSGGGTFKFSPSDALHTLPSTEARNFSLNNGNRFVFILFFAVFKRFSTRWLKIVITQCSRNPNIVFRDAEAHFMTCTTKTRWHFLSARPCQIRLSLIQRFFVESARVVMFNFVE